MAAHQNAKYKALANDIIERIQQKQLKEGDKLPSLRQFCIQHNTSMTTAIRCFEHVEHLGFAIAVANKGFFVSLPLNHQKAEKFPQFTGKKIKASLKPSVIKQLISHRLANTDAQQQPLSSGQLGPSLIDHKGVSTCFNRALRHCQFQHFSYGDPSGNQHLREAITRHFAKKGLALNTEEIMISNGCIDAVTLSIETVTKPGDTIAVSSPCYNGLLQLIALTNRYVLEVPSTDQGIDLHQLRQLAKEQKIHACLLTASHQNPTGHQLPVEQKKSLAEFAQQYRIPIIEDDVYGELTHHGSMSLPIKYWDHGGWVIWCSSVSKSLSPGLRIGWLHSGRFYEDLFKQRFIRTLGINQPSQLGLAEFINTGLYAKHLMHVNFNLKKQITEYRYFLQTILPKNTYISSPEGGSVLWIKIPKLDSRRLMMECEIDNVYIRSGDLFSSRRLYRSFFRINAGWPLTEAIKKQLKIVRKHIFNQLKDL